MEIIILYKTQDLDNYVGTLSIDIIKKKLHVHSNKINCNNFN